MDIAAATDLEGGCACLTSELPVTTAQCLLVAGLDQCHHKWLPLVTARMQQASKKGMRMKRERERERERERVSSTYKEAPGLDPFNACSVTW